MKRKMRKGGNMGTGVFGLRVALVEEDGAWFAQGLDVDYFAAGATREEAKQNFEEGLTSTVKLHLKKFGSLHLTAAPLEVTNEYADLKFPTLTTTQLPHIKELAPQFPYSKVLYLEP